MNLKNLMLASIFVLMGGCDDKELDQALVDKLWAKTVEVVGIDPATPKPEIVMMDEDLYREILRKDCESEKSDEAEQECVLERKEMELSVLAKTGKNYEYRYGAGIWSDRALLAENCEKYADKERRKQCEADKFDRKNSKALARAFFRQRYVEIYYPLIRSYLYDYDRYYTRNRLTFSYGEKLGLFDSVIAHEMLHIALYEKKDADGKPIDPDDHHQLMRDKYMDPLLDFISDYEGTDRNGLHRDLAYGSLDAGIAGDQAIKRIKARNKGVKSESEKYFLVLPCGLRMFIR